MDTRKFTVHAQVTIYEEREYEIDEETEDIFYELQTLFEKDLDRDYGWADFDSVTIEEVEE